MIEREMGKEAASLIATAITERSENLHEDFVQLQRGDQKPVKVRVESLSAATSDVAAPAEPWDQV